MPGSIAARTMAWDRRMSGVAGPFSASGEASNGEPVQIELLINGVWTDITSYVMVRDNSGSIAITRGMRDEGGQSDHATLRLLLNNRDGRFSPRNPVGAYYGLIGRNTPIRVSVPNGIGGKAYRFWGEVSAWPQMWDPTGTDVWVELEASGILRRLSQGPPLENSPIFDAITTPEISGLRAYWPCEDASGATEIASALVTGSPMTFLASPELATSEIFGGSFALPTFTGAATTGSVPKYTDDPSATQVRFLLYIPPEGTSDGNLIARIEQKEDISLSNYEAYEIFYNAPNGAYVGVVNPGSLSINFRSLDGTTFGGTLHHDVDLRGRAVRVSLELEESGTSVNVAFRTLDLVSGAEVVVTQTRTTTQLTRCTKVLPFVSDLPGTPTAVGFPGAVMGHITVQDVITDIEDLGVRLDPGGETAGRRVQRLCAEEGVAFDGVGDLDSTVEMGGQGKLNRLSLMQECELADTGMLHENLAVLGLVYRTRQSLENQDPQITLNYGGFNLSEVPLPIEDDRYVQNKVTVTVKEVSATYALEDGSALAAVQPPAGVGIYGTDLSLNLFDTDDAPDHAAWRVHLGTVDEARHPSISVNLAHSSFTSDPALKQAVLGLRQGDRIQVTNPPSWLPPDAIDQIILGFEETVTHFEHRISFTCAPASPYTVGVLDTVASRIDTDGSELMTAVSSSATSLSVVPKLGQTGRWTTDSAEVPWDIRMGGEVMTVTSCTSWLNDTFSRSSSSSWGTADTGQAWSTVGAGPASDYNVGSGYGSHILSTVDESRRTAITPVSADADFYGSITTSALATGDSLFGALTARMLDSENMYMARLEFTTSNTIVLVLRRLFLNVGTNLGTFTLPDTHVADQYIRVRLQLTGAALKAKAWLASDVEPPSWHIEVTDTRIKDANTLGTRSIRTTGNTNAATVEIRHDNFEVLSPQTFTVTRSVNGVTKSHSAGSDIRLADPSILSL